MKQTWDRLEYYYPEVAVRDTWQEYLHKKLQILNISEKTMVLELPATPQDSSPVFLYLTHHP